MKEDPRPVFIFLDESYARLDKYIEEPLKKLDKGKNRFQLIFFPFPDIPSNKQGIDDWQVVSNVRDFLESRGFLEKYDLWQKEQSPALLLLTKDGKFTKQVIEGLSVANKEQKSNRQRIACYPKTKRIEFIFENEQYVNLYILVVGRGSYTSKEERIEAVTEKVYLFLYNNF